MSSRKRVPIKLKKQTFFTASPRLKKWFDAPMGTDFSLRLSILGWATALGFCLLVARYSYLSLLPTTMHARLKSQASKQFETEVTLTPNRADIVDRNGKPLAISIMQPSIFVVPKKLPKSAAERKQIAQQLGVPYKQIEELAKSKKGFAWLRRRLEPREFEAIGDLSGWKEFVGVIDEPRRIYPEKELAAHLIGVVGLDNTGLEGVEAVYNSRLNGEKIHARVMRDARGLLTLITPNGAVRPERTTEPLKLSIDVSVQYFAEEELRQGVEDARAKGGSAVVMDIESGELLAIASYPTYDLNDPPVDSPQRRRFRPIMDALELGSVVKPIFVAQAIDKGLIKPRDVIHCENGSYPVPGGKIRDDHPHGAISIGDVVKYSSNICTYKIVQKMGRRAFYETVIRSGLARAPGTGLPGEWAGRISKPDTWREMRFANMAFGQGIAISPLQITRALALISGGGKDTGVSILARDSDTKAGSHNMSMEAQLIRPETSRVITEMMSSVVEEEGGTGSRARIPGVSVAGKTGTAQKFSQATKSYSERIASFVGVLPAEKPKLAITVVIDEPAVRPAYGGTLAGPVFANIGSKTIKYLNSLGKLAFDLRDASEEKAHRERLAQKKKP
jgi:cell division protein FtsI (penicillin-binding protein 3)